MKKLSLEELTAKAIRQVQAQRKRNSNYRIAQREGSGFYLWVTRDGKNERLETLDGKPLTEKEADTIARKWSPSARVVVRPASYRAGK